jgi:hypothetical protein
MARVSLRRRLFMPALILIVGGALAVWGSQRQTQRQTEIRQMVLALCETARAKGDVRALVPTADPSLDVMLNAALVEVCAADELEAIDVSVRSGDLPGQKGATHVATISVLGVDRLALRMSDHDQRPVIIGFTWLTGT